ncbi:MAG TPA: protein-L-isoaspartate(D-aspartate) O-methyltransferase [Polyangiales bacterium]|nr:protein-L-isoaspartate(D-aspartate) O-methyltransferase [Polyangiales bacterium]
MPSRDIVSNSEEMVGDQLVRRGVADPRILDAMREVPREAFVNPADRGRAYSDCALALAHGQTISQPYMVARAAELAALKPTDVALDVGCGSGYQAAVLSRLCARVIGIELVPELALDAQRRLNELGFGNVSVQLGDGSLGLPEFAPYDAILVAAAARSIPAPLVDQLRVGGRLVIPVGPGKLQVLTVVTKTDHGIETAEYDTCVYVPLLGAAGGN